MSEGRSDDKLIRGGEVEVLTVELVLPHYTNPLDLSSVWTDISLYEDMETNYIRGEVLIGDTLNLVSHLPLIGNEKIIIEFKTPSRTSSLKFEGIVTHVIDREQTTPGSQLYILHFISPEFVRNQQIKFSKSYNELLISDMVVDIYENYLAGVNNKKLHISPTRNNLSRVVPTFSPIRAITWLSNYAQSPSYINSASYVFFENRFGYYFVPFDQLIDNSLSREPAATYSRRVVQAHSEDNRNIIRGHFNINNFSVISPDLLLGITNGMYSSKMVTHDLVRRTIYENQFDYFQTYNDTSHTETSRAAGGRGISALHNDVRFGRFYDSRIFNNPSQYALFNTKNPEDASDLTIQIRESRLVQMAQLQLEITVPGDTERTIGEVIEIILPSMGTTNAKGYEGEKDKYLSGRYLISALHHAISRTAGMNPVHSMIMNVRKDSYAAGLPIL